MISAQNPFAHVILNRKPMVYDHRDYMLRDYMTPLMFQGAALRKSWYWPVSHILDQELSPHCVGFAWASFGITLPVGQPTWQNAMGHKLYYAAKVEDGFPKAENGSNTRSGAKAFMQFSKFEGGIYAFASTLDQIVTWLLTNGPCVTGTNWYTGMMSPTSTGLLRLTGNWEGGHEWILTGVDTDTRLLQGTNSWGTAFGKHGQFYIRFDDYQRLLDEQGDAVVAQEAYPYPRPKRRLAKRGARHAR